MPTKYIVIAIILLAVSVVFFEFSHVDLAIQSQLYDLASHQWLLDRNEPVAKLIFYDGIKQLYIVFILAILLLLVFFARHKKVAEYRHGMLIVVLSAILVPGSVSALKSITKVPCPRDIQMFGGEFPYVKLFQHYPAAYQQRRKPGCFPAGHASGGFALLSLFFLFKSRKNRIRATAFALTVGWSTGIYKMLIGDHFLGHTVASMLFAAVIVSLIANGVYFVAGRFKARADNIVQPQPAE